MARRQENFKNQNRPLSLEFLSVFDLSSLNSSIYCCNLADQRRGRPVGAHTSNNMYVKQVKVECVKPVHQTIGDLHWNICAPDAKQTRENGIFAA